MEPSDEKTRKLEAALNKALAEIARLEGEQAACLEEKQAVERQAGRALKCFDLAEVILLALDRQGKVVMINRKGCEVTGYREEEITGESWIQRCIPEEDREATWTAYSNAMAQGAVHPSEYENEILTRSGEKRTVLWRMTKIAEGSDTGQSSLASGLDVTEQRRAEHAQMKMERIHHALVSALPDAVVTVDGDGRFLNASQQAAELHGFSTPEAMIGKSVWDVTAQDDLEETRREFAGILASGEARAVETRIRKQNGERIVVEVNARLLRFPDREAPVLVGVVRDITERKEAEAQLKESREQLRNLAAHLQSAREEERTAVAREIHDELGQVLTVLKFGITSLQKKLPADCAALHEKAHELIGMADRTITTVKRIVTELRPGLLDELGLVAAIDWQAGEFCKQTGIQCEVASAGVRADLPSDLSTTFFRIFQEAMTNVARHARAGKVEVCLIERGGVLELTITDDGVGLNLTETAPLSYGLMGIRERVYAAGGEVHLSSAKRRGTTLCVRVPLPE